MQLKTTERGRTILVVEKSVRSSIIHVVCAYVVDTLMLFMQNSNYVAFIHSDSFTTSTHQKQHYSYNIDLIYKKPSCR